MHSGMLHVVRLKGMNVIYQVIVPLFLELFNKIFYCHEQDSNL